MRTKTTVNEATGEHITDCGNVSVSVHWYLYSYARYIIAIIGSGTVGGGQSSICVDQLGNLSSCAGSCV